MNKYNLITIKNEMTKKTRDGGEKKKEWDVGDT
jgi:hypothetical protein